MTFSCIYYGGCFSYSASFFYYYCFCISYRAGAMMTHSKDGGAPICNGSDTGWRGFPWMGGWDLHRTGPGLSRQPGKSSHRGMMVGEAGQGERGGRGLSRCVHMRHENDPLFGTFWTAMICYCSFLLSMLSGEFARMRAD
ncbi:hypothetical protein F4861DRAFT_503023, partial [Xylaria intraflava]